MRRNNNQVKSAQTKTTKIKGAVTMIVLTKKTAMQMTAIAGSTKPQTNMNDIFLKTITIITITLHKPLSINIPHNINKEKKQIP